MLLLLNVIEAFNSASIYLDDLQNIDNPYFEHIVSPTLQNKTNSINIETIFGNEQWGIVSSKIYDK